MTVFPQLEQQLMAAAGPQAAPRRRRRVRFLRGGLPLLAGGVLVAGSAAAATGLWEPLGSPDPPPRPAITVAKERFSVLHRGRDVLDDPALARMIRNVARGTKRFAKTSPVPISQTPTIDRARLARVDGRYRTFVLSGPQAICTATTKTRSTLGGLVCWTREDQLRELADDGFLTSAGKVEGGWMLSTLVPDGTRDAALTYADERVEPVAIRGNVAAVVVPEDRSPTAFTWTTPDGAPQRVENPVPTIPPLPPRHPRVRR